MASRILAQILVAGATTVVRAASQAWAQALQNAHKTGVAQEAAKGAAKVTQGIGLEEARQILRVDPQASWVDVAKLLWHQGQLNKYDKRYRHMMEVNQKYGSFYLESKVFRAWEALDEQYTQEGRKTAKEEKLVQQLLHQEPQQQEQQQEEQQQPPQQQQQDEGKQQ